MSAFETKMTIADALMRIVETKSLRKISVADIVSEVGMNRKTFYYHFTDKNNLVAWIFRYDLAQILKQRIEENYLIYSKEGDKTFDDLPYYTLVKKGVRSIDGLPFVDAFITTLESNRKFYAQALLDSSPTGLPAYLRRIYIPALERDTAFILSNRFLGKEQQRFLAEYHFEALLGYMTTHLLHNDTTPALQNFGPFGNIMHTSIADTIARQQHVRAAEFTNSN